MVVIGPWNLSVSFLNKVKKIILISTRPGLDKPEAKRRRLEKANRVLKEDTGFLGKSMVPSLSGKTTLEKELDVFEKLKNWIHKTYPHAIALAQGAMAQRRNQTKLLTKIQVMTLEMAGNGDALIPSLEAETMARELPNNLLEIFQLEDPKKFKNQLTSFSSSKFHLLKIGNVWTL